MLSRWRGTKSYGQHTWYLVTASIVLMSVPCDAPAQPVIGNAITCEGVFGKESSYERLVEVFGNENVAVEEITGYENITAPVTVVYPNDPAHRLLLSWNENKSKRGLASIIVGHDSKWTIKPDIHAGASLDQIEASNGQPFTLLSFEVDDGGSVTDWHGGALSRGPGDCKLGMRFEVSDDDATVTLHEKLSNRTFNQIPSEGEGEVDSKQWMQDRLFASNDPDIRAFKAWVASITIYYPTHE